MTEPHANDRLSVPAIICYVLLFELFLFGVGIFTLIMMQVKVQDVMLGVLGTFLAAITGNTGLAVGYFVGASVGGKNALDNIGKPGAIGGGTLSLNAEIKPVDGAQQ